MKLGKVLLVFFLLADIAFAARPALDYAPWTAYMLGADSSEALSAIRTAVWGKTVKVACANWESGHDDMEMSEAEQIAKYLGFTVETVQIHANGRDYEAIYRDAAASGDIVVDYHSYWVSEKVEQISRTIVDNPDKLFILPYGQIYDETSCPPTSTSLQGKSRNADGSGFANLVTTIPLAYKADGRLMYPLRRTAADAATVTFVAPSAWATSAGTTCPSAASAVAVAAYVYAVRGNHPSAAEIVRIMTQGSGLPRPSAEAEFSMADLGNLKTCLAELSSRDALGRKQLLNGAVLNLKGSLDFMNAEDSGVYVTDSFERNAVGVEADSLVGWHGDGRVTSETYDPALPPGYALPEETHEKVWDVDGEAIRDIPAAVATNGEVDVMLCIRRARAELDALSDDVYVGLSCDRAGRLCLWHSYVENSIWRRGWTPLSATTYSDSKWVRVCLKFDHGSNGDGFALVRVAIDGSCQPTSRGVRSPEVTTSYGSWYFLANQDRSGEGLHEISFINHRVDDLVIRKSSVAGECRGGTSTNGIEYAWFDDWGLQRDPLAPAPFIPGYTLEMVHDAGVNPYLNRPLEITEVHFGTNGDLQVRFNGYRGEHPDSIYRMIYSPSPDFTASPELSEVKGVFTGDAFTGTTLWSGSFLWGNAGFFRIQVQ